MVEHGIKLNKWDNKNNILDPIIIDLILKGYSLQKAFNILHDDIKTSYKTFHKRILSIQFNTFMPVEVINDIRFKSLRFSINELSKMYSKSTFLLRKIGEELNIEFLRKKNSGKNRKKINLIRQDNINSMKKNDKITSGSCCKKIMCEPSIIRLKEIVDNDEIDVNLDIAIHCLKDLNKRSYKQNIPFSNSFVYTAIYLSSNLTMRSLDHEVIIRSCINHLFPNIVDKHERTYCPYFRGIYQKEFLKYLISKNVIF
jgi:hypothetical protein